MATQLIVVLLTAIVTSATTLGLAWLLYRAGLERRLDARLLELQEEFEKRVKSGVLAAGTELLPALREQVAEGFRDALRGSEAVGLVEGGAKVVSRSADLLGEGLGALFGIKPRR